MSELIPTTYQHKFQNISLKGSDKSGIFLFREKTEMWTESDFNLFQEKYKTLNNCY